MTPTLAIVGRPNVGKSTLFNRLTRSRDAIVADVPGLTRDRHYGRGRVGGRPYIVVDTGGLEPELETGVQHHMARQTLQAVDEADGVIFLVDGRAGLTAQDRAIADQLRKSGRGLWLVVNKAEGLSPAVAGNEFHELGLGDPLSISAAHGDGISDLMDEVLAGFPGAPVEAEEEDFPEAEEEDEAEEDEAGPADRRKGRDDANRHPRIAIVGRPNVGKSTLVNHWLGEERVIAFDQPGTTRDSIEIEFERGGKPYTLIDTAGLRRRGKVIETVEKFSVVKTLQAIEDANVVVLMLDAQSGVSDQDAHIAGYVLESGRALVVAINKWDGLSTELREAAHRNFERILDFLDFAVVQNISARTGQGTDALFAAVGQAYAAAMTRLPTPKLTRTLMAAVERQAPPRGGVSRPKMRYAHQGGVNPPRVVIHGNSLNHVPETYRRYLERFFREAFQLQGTPLRIEFRRGANPYSGRRKRR